MSETKSFRNGHKRPVPDPIKVLSRAQYREVLYARIEAGDERATHLLAEVRRVDKLLDRMRDKPLYPPENKDKKKESAQ